MTGALLTIGLIIAGAPGLSLVSDYIANEQPDLKPPRYCSFSAAQGESETIVLRIENDDTERTLNGIDLVLGDEEENTLQAFRRATDGDYLPGATTIADAYAPLESLTLSKNSTVEFLLVLQISPFEKPGKHTGAIQATFEDGHVAKSNFEVQVYDFLLPRKRTLTALFDLDLDTMAANTVTPLSDLDGWTPLYDGLAAFGVACRIWITPTATPNTTSMDMSVLLKHVAYAAATMNGAVVDVGGTPGFYVAHFPLPTPLSPQDPLQTYMHAFLDGIPPIERGAVPVAEPGHFGPRSQWQELRQQYARFRRADGRIERILASPAHPHFERYTDIWALPPTTAPELVRLLGAGQSIIRYDQSALSICVGTEGALDGSKRFQTLASEAADGSEGTAWRASTSNPSQAPWVELTFREYLAVEVISLLGPSVGTMKEPEVETAYRPGAYAQATVSWKRSRGLSESGVPILIGELRYPRDCKSIRLRFPAPDDKQPIEITEILFNNETLETISNPIDPIIPWLDGSASNFSGWGSDTLTYGGAARAVPWRCWALGFEGILGPSLNLATGEGTPLAGSGVNQLLPTRRLFALRDGMDDYEYLRLYWNRVADGELTPPSGFAPGQGTDTFGWTFKEHLVRQETRNTLGRLLSGKGIVTTNFGP